MFVLYKKDYQLLTATESLDTGTDKQRRWTETVWMSTDYKAIRTEMNRRLKKQFRFKPKARVNETEDEVRFKAKAKAGVRWCLFKPNRWRPGRGIERSGNLLSSLLLNLNFKYDGREAVQKETCVAVSLQGSEQKMALQQHAASKIGGSPTFPQAIGRFQPKPVDSKGWFKSICRKRAA